MILFVHKIAWVESGHHECYFRDWLKNITLAKKFITNEKSTFVIAFTKILVILNTWWLIIFNKFDEDFTKIVYFLLLVYFWFSVILHESVSSYQALAKASSRNCLFWSPFFS